jgi:hypothetical protein
MRINERGVVVAAVLAVLVAYGDASADNNPGSLVFRAVNFVKGRAEIDVGQIKCDIPTTDTGIADGAFAMGIWNTFGFSNLYFPDPNHPFANPCGGWVQVQNNLFDQSIMIEKVQLRFKIPGARRFQQFAPTRNGFPVACRQFRRDTLFIGGFLNPANAPGRHGGGKPNVAFIPAPPMVSTQLFNCLRGQYGSLSTDLYSSLPLVIRVTVFGVSDSGENYKTNTLAYTLNLRHVQRLRRRPASSAIRRAEPLRPRRVRRRRAASYTDKLCNVDADCNGTCTSSAVPEECICLF